METIGGEARLVVHEEEVRLAAVAANAGRAWAVQGARAMAAAMLAGPLAAGVGVGVGDQAMVGAAREDPHGGAEEGLDPVAAASQG